MLHLVRFVPIQEFQVYNNHQESIELSISCSLVSADVQFQSSHQAISQISSIDILPPTFRCTLVHSN